MSKRDFIRFLRAFAATLLSGLAVWLFAKMGIQISIPHVQGK